MVVTNDKVHAQAICILDFIDRFDTAVERNDKTATILFGRIDTFGGNTISLRIAVRNIIDEVVRLGAQERIHECDSRRTIHIIIAIDHDSLMVIYRRTQSIDRRSHISHEEWVMQAMRAQGFIRDSDGVFQIPQDGVSMKIPAALIPKCPDDGSDMTMNLRADDSFVEDEGWHNASTTYADFIRRHENLHTLYLEIGVGANTPVIIKYPFWAMTAENPKAVYACLNYDEAFCPKEIEGQSICIDGDARDLLESLCSDNWRRTL